MQATLRRSAVRGEGVTSEMSALKDDTMFVIMPPFEVATMVQVAKPMYFELCFYVVFYLTYISAYYYCYFYVSLCCFALFGTCVVWHVCCALCYVVFCGSCVLYV